MSTDVDWQHELDSSFGSGRDIPAGHYVAAGRTAVRRRRIAAVVATAAVVVAGGAAWAASPGSAPRSDAPVATQGAAPEQDDSRRDRARDREQPSSIPTMSVREEFLGNPAVIEPDGTVKMSPLAGKVLQRLPNPMDYTPDQGISVALRVMYEGSEKYSLMTLTQNGASLSTTTHDATGDFPGWVAGVAASQHTLDVMNDVVGSAATDDGTDPATWLELGPDGTPVPTRPGVVTVEVRADVDLDEGFAGAADPTGVMRLLVDGTPRVVAYRVLGGQLDVIPGPGRFDSLDAFITWARSQYASGEGMR